MVEIKGLPDLVQRRTLVHGDVFGLVALDLVLRVGRAGVMGVAPVDMDPGYAAA